MTTPACYLSPLPPATWDPIDQEIETYAERWHRVKLAQGVCADCPLRVECGDVAEERKESGVWGGKYWVHGQRVRMAKTPPHPDAVPRKRDRKAERDRSVVIGFQLQPIKHGTEGGAKAEKRRGLDVCDTCRAAYNAASNRRGKLARQRRKERAK